MNKYIIKTLVLSVVVLSISLNKKAAAQSHDIAVATGNTFFMAEMNPASQMRESYLVFPFFGNFGVNVSSPISINQAIKTSGSENYLNSPKVVSALNNGGVNLGFNMDVISFGVKFSGDNMISFSSKIKTGGSMMLPGDALAFLTDNSLTALNSYELKMGSDLSSYGEFALGYSGRVWDNLKVGARFKYLAGVAYIGSDSKAQLRLRDDATYDISGDVDIRLVGVGLDKNTRNIGIGVNNGFGFDIGAEYEFDFRLKLGASMTDIGFINWNKGERTQIVSSDPTAVYHFMGLEDMGKYFDNSAGKSNPIDQLGKDLMDKLKLDTLRNELSFKSKLVSNLNVYGSYAIDRDNRHNISLNMVTRFNPNQTLKNDFSTTLGYTYCNKNSSFRALAAYTISTRLGSKFSTGIVTESRGGQFYLLLDATPMFGLEKARSVGVRIGGIFYLSKNDIKK